MEKSCINARSSKSPLQIAITNIINITKGKELKLDIFAYTESENTRPKSFKAQFVPRSQKIRELIDTEAEAARDALRIYDGETKLSMEDAVANPAMH